LSVLSDINETVIYSGLFDFFPAVLLWSRQSSWNQSVYARSEIKQYRQQIFHIKLTEINNGLNRSM